MKRRRRNYMSMKRRRRNYMSYEEEEEEQLYAYVATYILM